MKKQDPIHAAAVALGRKGGQATGPTKSAGARIAARARWDREADTPRGRWVIARRREAAAYRAMQGEWTDGHKSAYSAALAAEMDAWRAYIDSTR